MRQFKPIRAAALVGLAISAAVTVTSFTSQAAPVARAGTPVAIELFTSQGCSSCPPADALAERLVREPNTIILTRPVTYWDQLGWKDTLAREANTQLQRAYAARGGYGAGVYTPQAVVQGGSAVVGSREGELRTLIRAAQAQPGPAISATLAPDGGRIVTISGSIGERAVVSVVALRNEAVVQIGRGENSGRTVRYANVVVDETRVTELSGAGGRIAVPAALISRTGANRYVLLIRQGSAGKIVAVRYI